MVESAPLNGRSYTDLLALQPRGCSGHHSYRNVDPGGRSERHLPFGRFGSRHNFHQWPAQNTANGFTVNDADVVERFTMGAAIIPNLDSISEFRILTGNFEAQYGNYSGGRIQVITKSSSNQFHGSAFDFLRNTDLDSKNYFADGRGVFQQNQFGGTIGGPISRRHVYFFADYQGTRMKQGCGNRPDTCSVVARQDRQLVGFGRFLRNCGCEW